MNIENGYSTQVESTHEGYVVSAYFILPPDTIERWHRLRNFGERQSDAYEFKNDVQFLTNISLKVLSKRFDISVKYERINARVFKKIKEGEI